MVAQKAVRAVLIRNPCHIMHPNEYVIVSMPSPNNWTNFRKFFISLNWLRLSTFRYYLGHTWRCDDIWGTGLDKLFFFYVNIIYFEVSE